MTALDFLFMLVGFNLVGLAFAVAYFYPNE